MVSTIPKKAKIAPQQATGFSEKVEKSTKDTMVLSFPTIRPASWKPINARNNPIPTDMATFIFFGIAITIFSRKEHKVIRINNAPEMNTIASDAS